MAASKTPLFDKLNETIDFVWCRTVPLFGSLESPSGGGRPTDAQDWFLIKFFGSMSERAGAIPPFETTRFYRMADRWEGLPKSDLLRRELNKAIISCSVQQQVNILCSEIEKTCDRILEITSFLFNDMPKLTSGWVETFQKAIDKSQDKVWLENFVKRTGKTESDIIYHRDYLWNDAIKYFKKLPNLALGFHRYTFELREFRSVTSQFSQGYIHKLSVNEETDKMIPLRVDFKNIFDTECDAYVCLSLLQRFNMIKSDGTHQIGVRDKSRLMAFVEVLQQKQLLPTSRPTSELTGIFSQQIGLQYHRARNTVVKKYDDYLRGYINQLNSISTGPLTWSIMADNG